MATAKYPPHPAFIEHEDGSITSYSKTCTRCRVTKLMDEFGREGRSTDGRTPACKTCHRERDRRYHADNADNPEYRERKREHARRYREADPEKTREHVRRFYEANPEKMREYDRRKRAAYANRTDAEVLADRARLRPDGLKKCRAGHFTPLDEFRDDRAQADGLHGLCRAHDTKLLKHAIDRWEELDLWRCIYCDAPFEDIEHSIPRSRAAEFGLDDPDDINNLVPSCSACNRGPGGKHAQTPAEWRPVEHAAMREVVSRLRASE